METRLPEQERAPTGGWQTLVDEIDVILWEANPEDFRFLYVSQGAERVLGYPPEEWISSENFWVRFVHPEDRAAAIELCSSETRAGRDHRMEYRAIRRDGSEVTLRDLVHVVKDEAGNPILLRGAMMDVTDRRRIEEALAEEQARYRILADNALDLVSLHAEDGRFLFVSPSCREITGYDPEELIGRGLDAVVHPEDLPDLYTAIRLVLDGAEPPAIVFRVLHRSGEIRWCETKGNLVVPSEGHGEVRLVGVTRDISERRILLEEL
jgi:PAS domain S-box-containing protein